MLSKLHQGIPACRLCLWCLKSTLHFASRESHVEDHCHLNTTSPTSNWMPDQRVKFLRYICLKALHAFSSNNVRIISKLPPIISFDTHQPHILLSIILSCCRDLNPTFKCKNLRKNHVWWHWTFYSAFFIKMYNYLHFTFHVFILHIYRFLTLTKSLPLIFIRLSRRYFKWDQIVGSFICKRAFIAVHLLNWVVR